MGAKREQMTFGFYPNPCWYGLRRRMTERGRTSGGRGAAMGAGAAVGADGTISAPVSDGVESPAEPRSAAGVHARAARRVRRRRPRARHRWWADGHGHGAAARRQRVEHEPALSQAAGQIVGPALRAEPLRLLEPARVPVDHPRGHNDDDARRDRMAGHLAPANRLTAHPVGRRVQSSTRFHSPGGLPGDSLIAGRPNLRLAYKLDDRLGRSSGECRLNPLHAGAGDGRCPTRQN
jgi:hypothetical protein